MRGKTGGMQVNVKKKKHKIQKEKSKRNGVRASEKIHFQSDGPEEKMEMGGKRNLI